MILLFSFLIILLTFTFFDKINQLLMWYIKKSNNQIKLINY